MEKVITMFTVSHTQTGVVLTYSWSEIDENGNTVKPNNRGSLTLVKGMEAELEAVETLTARALEHLNSVK